jgi:hypothetical protein
MLPPVKAPYHELFNIKKNFFLEVLKSYHTPNTAPTVTDKPIDNGYEPPRSLRFLSMHDRAVNVSMNVIINSTPTAVKTEKQLQSINETKWNLKSSDNLNYVKLLD